MSDFKEENEEEEVAKPKRLKVRNANCDADSKSRSSARIMEKFVKKGQHQAAEPMTTVVEQCRQSESDCKSGLIGLKEFFSFICPHCAESFEGNRDFYDQHIDSCFSRSVG